MAQGKFVLIWSVLASWAALATAEEPAARFDKVVQPIVRAYNAEEYPRIRRDFGQAMLVALPLEKSNQVFRGLRAQLGRIAKLESPRLSPPGEALFVTHFEHGTLDLRLNLDDHDKIVGLLFMPHVEPIPVPERHHTVLSLPFDGQWFVLWGGDTRELNHHHDTPNQRYAFDFVVVDNFGKTHKGEGKRNEDYFAFGRPVLAPADGVVTDVITGVRDNVPGSMNPYAAVGNSVIIEHRQYEVSCLGHFKQGSIRVKVGDSVKRGQILGFCGNSGNSSEPHIHYHLQNTPIIQDGSGIRCRFDKVRITKDGTTAEKANYSPIKGDVVSKQ